MSAWPEAVWLKQQIAGLLEIKDLEQQIGELETTANALSNEINTFINNEFFTTIIPEANFQSFTIDQQDIDFKNDIIKVNSATVFLTTNSSSDIETSLILRFKKIPVLDLSNTTWFLDTTKEPQSLPEEIMEAYELNFIINSQSYKNLYLSPGLILGRTLGDDYITFYGENGWNSDIDLSNIHITEGSDATNISLISWFNLNGGLKEEEEE